MSSFMVTKKLVILLHKFYIAKNEKRSTAMLSTDQFHINSSSFKRMKGKYKVSFILKAFKRLNEFCTVQESSALKHKEVFS